MQCTAVLSADVAFNIATLGVMPFYAMIVSAPEQPLTRKIMGSHVPFTTAAIIYASLLVLWNPLAHVWSVIKASALATAGLPSITAFAAAFNSAEATTMAWLHLVVLDLFQARYVHLMFSFIEK